MARGVLKRTAASFQGVKGFNPEKNVLKNNASKAYQNIEREVKDVVDPSVLKEFKGKMNKKDFENVPFAQAETKMYDEIRGMDISRREANWGPISNSNDVARRQKWAEKEYDRDYTASMNLQRERGNQRMAASQAASAPPPAISFSGMSPQKGMSKTEAYQRKDQIQKFKSAEQMRVNGDMDQTLMKRFGLDEQGLNNYKQMDDAKRGEFYQAHMDQRIARKGIVDPLMAHKAPQIAGGALATAGLVSAMSSAKGQQSNSQLYGQQQPYY